MEALNHVPLVPCTACATEFDVSGCTPFALMACPACGETTRVRTIIQQYEIIREIGRGGMSQVFLAKDPSLDREVAIKVLLDKFNQDDERLSQFEKEAQITASFAHPNVVKVYAVGRDLGDLFIVMELVKNGSLDELLADQGKVPESQALTWAHETAQGLQAAYQNGLIHRDVKPGNILLAKDRSAKLVDFGLALMFQREVDQSEDVWATPFYVSPEKLLGQGEDHRSDIYSLGATLYQVLVGEPSFEVITGSYEELHAAKTKPVPMKALQANASPATCALIDRMMAVSPDDRPADYESLLQEIEQAQSGKALQGAAGDRFLAQQRSKQKLSGQKPPLALVATLLLLAAALGAYIFTRKPNTSPQQANSAPSLPAEIAHPGSTTPFASARALLLAGKWTDAAQAFRSLYDDPSTSSGVRQMALYHGGISTLMDSRVPASKKQFTLLSDFVGPRQDLNRFFRSLSGTLLEKGPVLKEVAEDTPEGFCHPLALLAYGLKNWELGAFPQAEAHLSRFTTIKPGDDFQWIQDYHSLAQDRLADLAILNKLPPENAQTIEGLADLKERVRTNKARRFLSKRQELLAASKNTPEPPKEISAQGESLAWRQIYEELQPLKTSLDFAKGRALLESRAASFTSKRGRVALSDHLHIWTKAEAIFAHLSGKEGPLELLDGQQINGTLLSISPDTLTIQGAIRETVHPTSSITPKSLSRVALKALDDVTDANEYYDRQETLVCFASLVGLDRLERKQAMALARENRPFRQRWKRWRAFSHPSDNS